MTPLERKRLIERAASLATGLLAQSPADPPDRVVRMGGSAMLVAPYLALTASHVLRDQFRLTGQPLRERPGYFETEHGSVLFQVNPLRGEVPTSIWIVDRSWVPVWGDISLMQVSPDAAGFVGGNVAVPTNYFEWSVLPPPVGERVSLLGYPQTDGRLIDGHLSVDVNLLYLEATVTAVHEIRRDRGMLRFPCFEVDAQVEGGFSGGPVIWNNRLCGLVSAGTLEGTTAIASLWPIGLLEYEYPGLGQPTVLGELLDSGVIRSADWTATKPRISKQTDEDGRDACVIAPSGLT